jgi:hypothetical protein
MRLGLVWFGAALAAAISIGCAGPRPEVRTALTDSLAAAQMSMAAIRRVYTPHSLARAPRTDQEARLWRRAIPPTQGWLTAASLATGDVWGRTDHGSTNLLDQQVPIAFWGEGIPAGRPTRTISTTDIAPTLAALLGLRPTEPVDGALLSEVLPRRTAPLPRGLHP